MDRNTLVFYTTDNGAWQDVYPDAGYTPFRGVQKALLREGGNRVPAIAVWPGKIKPRTKSHDVVGGLDLMATFAAVGGVPLPDKDREEKPIIFDSYDMSPILLGTGKSERKSWFYFTENEALAGRDTLQQLQVRHSTSRGDDGSLRREGWLSTPTSAGRVRRSM